MGELKPCPFCGSDKVKINIRTNNGWVECQECNSKGKYIVISQAMIKEIIKERAINAWNKRERGGE